MKRFIYILSVVALIAAIVLILVLNKKSNAEKTSLIANASAAVTVNTDVVKDTTYTAEFTANGLLEPVRELAFMSDVAGRITQIYVDEGSFVSKGKTLIQIDTEMLRADVMSNQASYDALKKDYERFKNSNEQGGVTDQQLDNMRTQLTAAESRLITSKRRLADGSIKAPISGVINKRYVEIGSYLNPGAHLFDIVDYSQLKVMCNVNESQILQIQNGQEVTISSETFRGETFPGKITFIGAKADRSFNFPIEITISQSKKQLKGGMFVNVNFDAGKTKSGILIPRNAISGSVKAAFVYVVNNGIAKKTNVTVGDMVGNKVEILSGLEKGDSIIVSGLINMSEGAKIKAL